ncbi:NAD(P)H-dependent oxidoreductase [Flavobacterium sp. GT3R68]|uniref:NAD(P)H-dependent oxidoreductase n=1 Tax=Flavobacterium sp. GT3R68 TaxID=2594437 RepID=UPI000F86822B|nr:NAD(P)H-dependent oxidoreductase [Flavobacterium sp. GT3R68]RTY91808.1 NAD(P)H-dependent oxidoreductase [Flavobacterium sp. GSN2]TRW90148.1 NAD(P)H-dependent oxidoreductase [Flavobacterium sp. GT3R68]
MSNFIHHQNWRYATKKFDAAKKIAPEDLNILKEAIRLSSSSYGLQPYKVLIVENKDLREKLKAAAWGQNQITDASQVIVFANLINIGNEEIDAYVRNISETRGIPTENLSGYGDFMKSKITSMAQDLKSIWTSKQTYLALGNLLNAAAELKIDVTPMEGFDAGAFNEILGLTEKGLNASVIATIGYRHNDDETQHHKKVRKSQEELFINL